LSHDIAIGADSGSISRSTIAGGSITFSFINMIKVSWQFTRFLEAFRSIMISPFTLKNSSTRGNRYSFRFHHFHLKSKKHPI